MNKYYIRIKNYYDKGIYREEHLQKLVASGALTEAEYNEILGIVIEEPEIDEEVTEEVESEPEAEVSGETEAVKQE